MTFVCGLAFMLLVNVSAIKPVGRPAEASFQKIPEARNLLLPKTTNIPYWVTRTPENHFVGISRVCRSIEEARQGALDSGIAQILQAMGAKYTLKHISTQRGNETHGNHDLNEKLTYTAKWFLQSLQQTVTESSIQEARDGFVCFVLLYFPPDKIIRLRQLNVGPEIGARIVKENKHRALIEVREKNGVRVTLTDYQIELETQNRHADLVTLFAWKVPKGSLKRSKGILGQKISVRGDSQTFSIPKPSVSTNIENWILGSETRVKIFLNGYDELGRQIRVTVRNINAGKAEPSF